MLSPSFALKEHLPGIPRSHLWENEASTWRFGPPESRTTHASFAPSMVWSIISPLLRGRPFFWTLTTALDLFIEIHKRCEVLRKMEASLTVVELDSMKKPRSGVN